MAEQLKQQRHLKQPTNNENGQFQSYKDNPSTADRTTAREKEEIIGKIRNLLDAYGLSYDQASEIIRKIKEDYKGMSDREKIFGKI